MGKFKVGDKVRFLHDYMDRKKGDIVEIIGFWEKGIEFIKDGIENSCYFSRVELCEDEITKNQRITALEKELAELKLIVHELRDKKSVVASTVKEEKHKSNNQLRDEIIEKAKKFIEETKNYTGIITKRKGYRYGEFTPVSDAEFIVNSEKNTIVCILKEQMNKKITLKGIAKCLPTDVFNEHIGKAIALGRALGLDVSEFEQAVQPTEFVVGQIIRTTHMALDDHEIIRIKGNNAYFMCGLREEFHYINRAKDENFKIINDTNAIYESEVE